MSQPFGPAYAGVYDALYADKDYSAECDLIERLFADHGQATVCDILDLGCGTGGHADLLAQRGHRVVGVDRSTAMIEQARRKSAAHPQSQPSYFAGDIRTFRCERRFDVALMMFAVIGYLVEDEDVLAALRTARLHLRKGGLLIFDCWFGPAVLQQRPSARRKTVDGANGRLTRHADGELDLERNRCRVRFRVDQEAGLVQADEMHDMRYFFAEELSWFLQAAGFRLLHVGGFNNPDQPPDTTTWNVIATAQAIAG